MRISKIKISFLKELQLFKHISSPYIVYLENVQGLKDKSCYRIRSGLPQTRIYFLASRKGRLTQYIFYYCQQKVTENYFSFKIINGTYFKTTDFYFYRTSRFYQLKTDIKASNCIFQFSRPVRCTLQFISHWRQQTTPPLPRHVMMMSWALICQRTHWIGNTLLSGLIIHFFLLNLFQCFLCSRFNSNVYCMALTKIIDIHLIWVHL